MDLFKKLNDFILTITSRNENFWEQRKLGEMITERKILRFDSREFPLSSFIKNEGVVPKSSRYDRSFLVKSNSKKYKETRLGDFIYSSNNLDTGSIGLNNYGNAVISPVYSIFTSKDTENLETSFINLLFKKNFYKNKMLRFRQGVTYGQWKIKENDFLNLKVYISNSVEIEKIIAIFSKISQCITLYDRKLKLLSQIKKYFLDNLFAKKEYPNLRFKGFTDAWEQRQLGKQNKITMGQSPSSKNYTDNPKDWILIQGNADLKSGKVAPRIYTSQLTKKADIGDIILTVRAPVGEVAITDYDAVLGRGVAAIKGNLFIYFALEKFKANNKWNMYSSGSTFDSITGKDLNNLPLFFPSETEENKIGVLLNKLDNLLALYENKQNYLTEIKNTLLNTMFI